MPVQFVGAVSMSDPLVPFRTAAGFALAFGFVAIVAPILYGADGRLVDVFTQ